MSRKKSTVHSPQSTVNEEDETSEYRIQNSGARRKEATEVPASLALCRGRHQRESINNSKLKMQKEEKLQI